MCICWAISSSRCQQPEGKGGKKSKWAASSQKHLYRIYITFSFSGTRRMEDYFKALGLLSCIPFYWIFTFWYQTRYILYSSSLKHFIPAVRRPSYIVLYRAKVFERILLRRNIIITSLTGWDNPCCNVCREKLDCWLSLTRIDLKPFKCAVWSWMTEPISITQREKKTVCDVISTWPVGIVVTID